MSYFIDVQNVSVTYFQDDRIHTIFKDMEVRVRQGEFLTVVGPSGCGKSTLLRLLLGAQRASSGTVLIDGHPVGHVNRDCGIVYQSYSLFPHLTVLDNISLGPLLDQTSLWDRFFAAPILAAEHAFRAIVWGANHLKNGIKNAGNHNNHHPPAPEPTPEEHRDRLLHRAPSKLSRAFEFLRFIKLRREFRETAGQFLLDIGLDPGDGDKYPFELSGGMRQRVAIAQAVIMKPKILLMDEPFGALDKARREEMQDFIHQQWKKFGLTVFFVTHDLDEAVKLGTRLICLSQYWKDENGKPGEGSRIVVDRKVMGGELSPSTFVGSQEFQVLVNKIGKAGLDPHHLQPVAEFDLSHEDAVKLEVKKGVQT